MNNTSDSDSRTVPASINIIDVLRGLGHRKTLIAGCAIAAFLSGVAVVNLVSPTYTTEAQVLVENLATPFDLVQPTEATRPEAVDDRVVASQISVVKSQDLGRRVIAALKLEERPDFNPLLKGLGMVSQVKLALGFGEDPRLKTPEERAMSAYSDNLAVYQLPQSNVIAIKFTGRDPDIAAQVANTLADIYVMATREGQVQPNERARGWLAQQIENLRNKVARSEAAVEEFRSQAGLLQGATMTLGTQEISELNTQITVAQAARAEAVARADSIRQLLATKGTVDASSDVLNSPVIQRLKEQRTEAVRRMAELSSVYLSNHPKMIAAQGEVTNIDRQIRSEALKVVDGLEEQARIAETREASLRASLEQMKGNESSANLQEVKLKALERDAAADRALLESMLARFADVSARQDPATRPGLARVIQDAAAPTAPTFPKTGPMVMLVTLAGLSFGLGIAFLLELMAAAAALNRRLSQVAQGIPAVSDAPAAPAAVPWRAPALVPLLDAVATVPAAGPAADLPAQVAGAEVTNAAARLAAWVVNLKQLSGACRFAVTAIGARPGETELIAVSLARALAAAGKRVVVLDLARAGSRIESLCHLMPGPGIADLVSGAADFTKVIGRDHGSAAHVLRYGLDRSDRAGALIEERIEPVMAALASSYELVIVHAGEASRETPGLVLKCHAAVLASPAARAADVTASAQALQSAGLRSVQYVEISSRPVAPAAEAPLRAVNA